MKKLLPKLLIAVFVFAAFFPPPLAHAQTQLEAPTPVVVPTGGLWVVDPEVTFIGKNAARSGLMLDWTLQNYNWVCVTPVANRQCDNSDNPLAKFWSLIVLYIVVPLLFFVILATAVVIIITRGRSLTIMRFIPRFIAVILLIMFSYSILQFFYQFIDLIQGFFLRSADNPCPPDCISQKDLLYVGWDYRAFIGLRLLGDYNAESAFISLLLTKLTALTYFVMIGILLMRKIILWFFIIVSPIFPILLLYYPTRNTAKIWIGEFFRWLLYAPLFAIFLKGLVFMWREQIPLVFDNPNIGNASQIIFPTAVNILLGGPRQFVTPTNSVNLTETFSLYVVALIMLWIVILLPWILLQIFLDYASNFAPGDSAVMKTLVNMAANKQSPPGGGGKGPSPSSQPGGMTLNLPFAKKFKMPASLAPTYKPGGAAKELVTENVTATQMTFAKPISTPNAQVTAQVLSIANVNIPSIRDIAKYETAMMSNDVSRQKEVALTKETLEKIANPVVVTNTVDREKYQDIHEKLTEQSNQGNIVATNIMNAVNAISSNSQKSQANNKELKSVLKQIANPASTTNTIDRSKYSKLHDALQKESKENNNKLASSILSVSDKTTVSELEKIKEQITQQQLQGNSTLASVNNAVQSNQVKKVIQQVSNPASAATPVEREKLVKLKDSLTKASKDGNQLAASLLNVSTVTPTAEIERLQEKIMEEKGKGVSFATEIADMASGGPATSLPAMNRVQTVTQQDFQAVKDMWKENYHNLEVPEGMAGTRAEWIKDDIGKIDNIVGMLTSTDQDKVNEGMQEVSNILPFLLMGGFSQTEIVSYLKAKQDAAKEVSVELAAEEETTVSVETKHATAERTMAATMDEGSSTSSNDDADDDSVLTNLSSATPVAAPQISTELLTMVNLQMPKMRDIARYEAMSLSKDSSKLAEVQKMNEVLERIANPTTIGAQADREHYEQLKQKLVDESKKGNMTATMILSAAAKTPSKIAGGEVKTTLSQIANPASIVSETDKKRFTELHDKLSQASQQGNELAASILAVKEDTSAEDIAALSEKLRDAKQKGEDIATSVLSNVNESAALPESNAVQAVAHEEYDEVKKMWVENYRTLPVPVGFHEDTAGRIEWITADGVQIQQTLDLLQAGEPEKKAEGLKKVSAVLPFLLLGGFSQQEMVEYLRTKQDAGKTVLGELKKDEGTQEKVAVAPQQQEGTKTMAAESEKKENG